uniref:Uncharacterized protein n=1 Tax=Oryza barthii TaxID=65489 RepID=A0A0D3EPM6_9ORYZ
MAGTRGDGDGTDTVALRSRCSWRWCPSHDMAPRWWMARIGGPSFREGSDPWPPWPDLASKSFTPLLANILPSMLLLPFYGRSASISGHWELRGKGRCGAFVELTMSR